MGPGRPGWHIECSAMSYELLGASFDIHGGGNDLMFPHHENEVAQSCCAHPEGQFANYWLHNEMLQVEGKKMSKSLGNFFTVHDLLEQGIPGEVIRFVFLSTHYGKPMDWTAKKAAEAEKTLQAWASLADSRCSGEIDTEVLDALKDDLNTAKAIQRLNQLSSHEDGPKLTASAALLGFDLNEIARADWATPFSSYETFVEGVDYQPTVGVVGWGRHSDETISFLMGLARNWLRLRREKKWAEADALRENAMSQGVELQAHRSEDGVNGATVVLGSAFDPAKLEGCCDGM